MSLDQLHKELLQRFQRDLERYILSCISPGMPQQRAEMLIHQKREHLQERMRDELAMHMQQYYYANPSKIDPVLLEWQKAADSGSLYQSLYQQQWPTGADNGTRKPTQEIYRGTSQRASTSNHGADATAYSLYGGAGLTTLYSRSIAEESRKPLESTGIKVGEITAWRIWKIEKGNILKSFGREVEWKPGIPMQGKPGDHDKAGVWAFKTTERALRKMNMQEGLWFMSTQFGSLDCTSEEYVMGSVAMWGDIVEHEDGYRASFARILTLDDCTTKHKEKTLKVFRKKYLKEKK